MAKSFSPKELTIQGLEPGTKQPENQSMAVIFQVILVIDQNCDKQANSWGISGNTFSYMRKS